MSDIRLCLCCVVSTMVIAQLNHPSIPTGALSVVLLLSRVLKFVRLGPVLT